MDRKHRPPRKKACSACTTAKARCDLVRPSCSRCCNRGIRCDYGNAAPAGPLHHRMRSGPGASEPEMIGSPTTVNTSTTPSATASPAFLSGVDRIDRPPDYTSVFQPFNAPENTTASRPPLTPSHVGNISLLTPLDFTKVRDRWLDFYFAPTTKTIKPYNARTIALIHRTLASYPAMLARNGGSSGGSSMTHSPIQLPPFIHPLQCTLNSGLPESLANCMSLLRLCGSAAPGSETLVMESLSREMSRLVTVVDAHTPATSSDVKKSLDDVSAPLAVTVDHTTPLAALQAYLLLAIHIYIHRSSSLPFNPGIISTAQDLAAKVSSTGLVCAAELSSTQQPPTRAAWAIAEAKRRTIYTVYFLENLHNFEAGATCYLGDELALLPAPGPGWLWRCGAEESEEVWRSKWSRWATMWEGRRAMVLAEFWPGDWENDGEVAKRREDRLTKWIEGVDEFGMFLLSVCTVTYDC